MLATGGFRDWKHIQKACKNNQGRKQQLIAMDKYNEYQTSLESGHGTALSQLNRDATDTTFSEIENIWKLGLTLIVLCKAEHGWLQEEW